MKNLLYLPVVFALVFAACGTVNPATSKPYIIGDTGPAGGIIFYYRPLAISFLTDWKYLEAAPEEMEVELPFGDLFVGETSDELGKGRYNTKKFYEKFLKNEKTITSRASDVAVQYCHDIVINGYDDWYLPNIEELREMYNYIKRRGQFKDERYWSSSYNSASGIQRFDFSTGTQHGSSASTTMKFKVRPMRRFIQINDGLAKTSTHETQGNKKIE